MKIPAIFTTIGVATAKWSPGSIDAADKPLVVLYYDEWSKWSQFFSVYQMERIILSRQMPVRNWVINYSFLAYSPETCRLVPTDTEVAWSSPETQMFPGSGWWDQNMPWGSPAGGMPAIIALRQKYPYIKFLFSVGGWSMSHTFSDCVRTAPDNMVESAKDFVYYFNFDGLDLDWEYPECPLDSPSADPKKVNGKCGCQGEPTCYDTAKGYYSPNKGQVGDWAYYKSFIEKLRAGFDELEDKMEKKLYVTAAIGMNPKHIDGDGDIWKAPLPVEWICSEDHFDWVNLMTYDFYGPWTPKTGHLSPLYKSTAQDADEVQISIDESIQKIMARCSRPEKLTMGLAAYGKGWSNVPNNGAVPGLWQTSENNLENVISANGTHGPKMTYEQGTVTYWDIKYNYLTNPNCKRTYDNESKAPTIYCTRITEPQYPGQDTLANNVFITYDDGESWADRMSYARKHGMAGAIIWAASNSGHEAFTTHDDRTTQTHDGVEDLYNGLFQGWYGYDNKIAAIGASGTYTFAGIQASELPNGSTCPYGKGVWRDQEYVYNACYDGVQADYQNSRYPQKSGSGPQDLVGKDVILIRPSSGSTTPSPLLTTTSTIATTTTAITTSSEKECNVAPECTLPADNTTTEGGSTSTTKDQESSSELQDCIQAPFVGGELTGHFCVDLCLYYHYETMPQKCPPTTTTLLECVSALAPQDLRCWLESDTTEGSTTAETAGTTASTTERSSRSTDVLDYQLQECLSTTFGDAGELWEGSCAYHCRLYHDKPEMCPPESTILECVYAVAPSHLLCGIDSNPGESTTEVSSGSSTPMSELQECVEAPFVGGESTGEFCVELCLIYHYDESMTCPSTASTLLECVTAVAAQNLGCWIASDSTEDVTVSTRESTTSTTTTMSQQLQECLGATFADAGELWQGSCAFHCRLYNERPELCPPTSTLLDCVYDLEFCRI